MKRVLPYLSAGIAAVVLMAVSCTVTPGQHDPDDDRDGRPDVVDPGFLVLSDRSMSFSDEGGTGTVTVSSNVTYTCTVADSDAGWLSVSGTPSVPDAVFTITVSPNEGPSLRCGHITFTGEGVDDVVLAVNQDNYVPVAVDPTVPYAANGTDCFVSTGEYNYRYGPSIIRNSDGSLDMWTSKEGEKYINSNSDITYQETGTRSKVSACGHTIAQYFNTQHRFMRVMVNLYGSGTTADEVDLRLYKWAGSYEATLASEPLNTFAISKTTLLYPDGNRYSIYKDEGHSWMDPGEYMWTATGATEEVGVFKYFGAGTIALTDSKSYFDGEPVTDYNFQAKLRGSAYNSSNFVDRFAYFHSTDGGATWSKERDVLFPTEGSEDHFSVCDPGVAFFGGWYYIGYTSAPSAYGGYYNHCYVARSRTPVGPWYKWNGSGWGGEPAKVIAFNGSTSAWGAGEPSIVVKDDTIYFYYTWIDSAGAWLPTTRLATAPVCDDWPAHLAEQGTVIDKVRLKDADSCDIKYIEDYGLFYAFHTYNRYIPSSAIAVWSSPDGRNFTYQGDMTGDLRPGLGNMGVSGDGMGHIRLRYPQFVSYSYATSGGRASWNTRFSPMIFGL